MLFIHGYQIAGVIFDIDGTLIDSFSAFGSVFNSGISQFNLEPVSNEYLANRLTRGLSLGEILRESFPFHTDESIIERCKKEILELFLKIEADEVKPFPGINELFKNLKDRGLKIGIATGRTSLPENEWKRFKKFGLDRFIDSIVTSREVERRKPAPDAIIECAKRLNVPIEKCLVVGDTELDIIATRSAGGIPAAVLTGENNIDLLEKEKPELIFKNLTDFALFLDEQERGGGES